LTAEVTLPPAHTEHISKVPCRVREGLVTAAFDGLASHIAVLDEAGFIVDVNAAWRRFAAQNGSCDPIGYIGANYIEVCRRATAAGDKLANEVIEGISAVISGAARRFNQRYTCHGPDGERWFLMTITPLCAAKGIVISHDDITPLVRAENAIATSELRLTLSLGASEMGTFEIDLQKEEIVFDLQQAKLLKLSTNSCRLPLGELDTMLLDYGATPFKQRIVSAGLHYSEELRLRLPDSSKRWLSFAAAPDPAGGLNSGHYFGICFDVTGRKLEEKNRFLSQEVRHRVKNMLAVIVAIARQTAFGDVPSASAEKLERRIAGLAASLDLLANRKELTPSALIQAQLTAFVDSFANQVSFEGPALTLHATAVQALGMAFHELATNSVKYGALSKDGGRISIQWEIEEDGQGKQFHMRWCEHGGPEVKAPTSRGFGFTVMVSAIESSLNGRVQLQYPSSGLVWKLTAPLDEIMALPS